MVEAGLVDEEDGGGRRRRKAGRMGATCLLRTNMARASNAPLETPLAETHPPPNSPIAPRMFSLHSQHPSTPVFAPTELPAEVYLLVHILFNLK